jgi:excinuclease ABC subunit C
MIAASDNLEFELAAGLRDQLNAVEALGKKQLVTAGSLADTDVIGYAETEAKACFAVLHFAGGNLLDKDYEILSVPEDRDAALSSLVKQYYLSRGVAPKVICLPSEMEDGDLFSQLLEQQFGKKTRIKVPIRGDAVRLVELAEKNALEEARRVTSHEERVSGTLQLLGKMLSIETPRRIEAFDISNISGTDIVASMIVFEDGAPRKSQYKKFKIHDLEDQDDYASMRQVVERRFTHFLAGDAGFDSKPDLLLIDGGINHAETVRSLLDTMGLKLNVFGMVKDDRHRTRALVTPDGLEIAIDTQQSVFALIGNIQEETHRFAITYHRELRSKRLRYSALDGIKGIGAKRKEELLKAFRSISAIKGASLDELSHFLPLDVARNVYQYFHEEEGN